MIGVDNGINAEGQPFADGIEQFRQFPLNGCYTYNDNGQATNTNE